MTLTTLHLDRATARITLRKSDAYMQSPGIEGLRLFVPEIEYNSITIKAHETGALEDVAPIIATLDRLPAHIRRDVSTVETTGGIEPGLVVHVRGQDPAKFAEEFDRAYSTACPDHGHAGIEVRGTVVQVKKTRPRGPGDI